MRKSTSGLVKRGHDPHVRSEQSVPVGALQKHRTNRIYRDRYKRRFFL